MKTSLLLLWSLASLPLQQNCTTCQGGANPAAAPTCSASAGCMSGSSGTSGVSDVSGAYGFSDGVGLFGRRKGQIVYMDGDPNGGYDEFNGPCRKCKKCKGRCCKDSTCDMYQHFPYLPDNWGYYYFRPYNYQMVWQHQQWTSTIGGDPRNPYSRAFFIPVYEQFENTTYEPDSKPKNQLDLLPNISKSLPDLEKLVKRPEGEAPVEPTPAPPPPAPENK